MNLILVALGKKCKRSADDKLSDNHDLILYGLLKWLVGTDCQGWRLSIDNVIIAYGNNPYQLKADQSCRLF